MFALSCSKIASSVHVKVSIAGGRRTTLDDQVRASVVEHGN